MRYKNHYYLRYSKKYRLAITHRFRIKLIRNLIFVILTLILFSLSILLYLFQTLEVALTLKYAFNYGFWGYFICLSLFYLFKFDLKLAKKISHYIQRR